VPSIYAIGDVTDRVNLTPVATAEGMALANTLFNNRPTALDYENIPTAIFANPNVATVGLSEEEARSRFGAIDLCNRRCDRPRQSDAGRDCGRDGGRQYAVQ
jgi:glutathione reductase (NADPH)